MKAIVTGSGGLIGSACTALLCEQGWEVLGIDNNMRSEFFGKDASTEAAVQALLECNPLYRHFQLDIRERILIRELFKEERPDLVIHTAAQPSHDLAASVPYDDFDINAVGTLNLLVAARDFCRESPFCFTSTNKVYGDRPNSLPMIELDRRFDYISNPDGIDETMSIDNCLHSLFGASKAAADLLCQEFGRYFNMPIGIFRCGCLTGPQHAAVQLHGYLTYIVRSAVQKKAYTIFGYKGKQVRDQLHSSDVAQLFLCFFKRPTAGEVYNIGGGRENSISVLETIDALASMNHRLDYTYKEENRIGDHICYISDMRKIRAHYPEWNVEYKLARILSEIVEGASGPH